MTQPYYQVPQPQIAMPTKKKGANWFGFIATAFIVVLSFGFLFYLLSYAVWGHPPTIGLIYKEYSSVTQVYKNAALGDRVKVTINARSSQVVNGAVQLTDSDSVGVVFRLPTDSKTHPQVFPGRNIIYCFLAERQGSTLYCDIEEIQI